MQIRLTELMEGAREAEGLTVIIDVFRAFSLECYMFRQGAEKIVAVGSREDAYALKERWPDALLIGERNEIPLPGFDYGNSPTLLQKTDLHGRTVIHTTSAGTQGIVNAVHADEILTGSLVNASAIADYIRKKKPEKVTLVAMGVNGKKRAEEDWLCAQYIKALAEGTEQELPMQERIDGLRQTTGSRFFEPERQKFGPEEDFYLCTKCNLFPFVIQAQAAETGYVMHCMKEW